MKTKMNISNLKKVAVTIFTVLMMTPGSYTQPSPDESSNKEMIAVVRLNALMNETETNLRFVAPAAEVIEEIAPAYERLNALAETTEVSVKYVAPSAEEVSAEIERLNNLANDIETRLQYKAPALSYQETVTPELERIGKLADATEASLVFKAPMANDAHESDFTTTNNSENMMACTNK
jgi:hypothetical protein